ncbi:MAG TPA: hypothetical protein VHB98_19745 [Chloroflexota bacterium]|nr:hypothetical protein [Chloroflexota bacterium]
MRSRAVQLLSVLAVALAIVGTGATGADKPAPIPEQVAALRTQVRLLQQQVTVLEHRATPTAIRGPAGPVGPQGPQGPAGPPGADAPAVLTSGQTVAGTVGAEFDASAASDQAANAVTFRIPAAVAPKAVTLGVRDGCQYPGQAPAGVLCLYPDSSNNVTASAINLSALGFVFLISSQGTGDAYWFGTYAYTQP